MSAAFGIYWKFFRTADTADIAGSDTNVEKKKVLNSDRIRVEPVNGQVANDGKMFIEMKIKGIGARDVMEEVRQDGNILIEINGTYTPKPNSEIKNDVLLIKTETILSPEQLNDFNDDKLQDLKINVDLRYADNDSAANIITAKFSKGKETTSDRSLGTAVVFGDIRIVPSTPKQRLKPSDVAKKTPDNDIGDDKPVQLRTPQTTIKPNPGGESATTAGTADKTPKPGQALSMEKETEKLTEAQKTVKEAKKKAEEAQKTVKEAEKKVEDAVKRTKRKP
jgi:hypothetical protein